MIPVSYMIDFVIVKVCAMQEIERRYSYANAAAIAINS